MNFLKEKKNPFRWLEVNGYRKEGTYALSKGKKRVRLENTKG